MGVYRSSSLTLVVAVMLAMMAPSAANAAYEGVILPGYSVVAAPVLLFLLVLYLEATRRPADLMDMPNVVAIDQP